MTTVPFRTADERRAATVRVAAHLHSGGLIAYPTETVYGFGCLLEPEPLRTLAALKQRDAGQPFIVLIPAATAPGLTSSGVARKLADTFWPGPLTLALPADPAIFPDEVRAADGTVGVRWSPEPAVADLLSAAGAPITSTSANAPGDAPARDAAAAAAAVRAVGADERFLILDGGTLPSSPPSTVVRVIADEAEILREGAVATPDILRVLGRNHVR